MSTADSTAAPTPEPTPAPQPARRRDPALLVVLGLIILLVVVALIVVFTRGQPVLLPAGTPGGVVQAYSAAVLAGDESTAVRYLTADAQSDCDPTSTPVTDDIRITLVDTVERESSADVRVLIVTSYESGPFGASEYESEEAFDLVGTDGDWLIERAPWQLTVCEPTGQGDDR